MQTADNSHCSVSPASAFAIATAAAGHGSPPGEGLCCAGRGGSGTHGFSGDKHSSERASVFLRANAQVTWDLEQTGLVESVPACGRVGTGYF